MFALFQQRVLAVIGQGATEAEILTALGFTDKARSIITRNAIQALERSGAVRREGNTLRAV